MTTILIDTPDGHIERICEHAGILRVGGAYGQAWTNACVLRFDGTEAVTVEAVERAPTSSEWRKGAAVLRLAGFTTAKFVRQRPEGPEERAWRL